MRRLPVAAGVLAVSAGFLAAGCGSNHGTSGASPPAAVTVTATPTPTVTVTPTPTPTVTVTPPPTVTVTPTPTPTVTVTRPAGSAPAATTPAFTNATAVVTQYYQDITNHDYAAAWALGGKNIAGGSYDGYVKGFATTASIALGTTSEFGSGQVQAVIYATQTDGTVKTFQGTYTVANGVLVGASIRQTG